MKGKAENNQAYHNIKRVLSLALLQENNAFMSLNGMKVVANQQQRLRRDPAGEGVGGARGVSAWEGGKVANGGHQQL